jgi:DNA end-binding protein Ku
MAPRTYWTGYLRLSLVTIGVELYAAVTSAETTALHQIHKPTGKRIRYQKVVPDVGPVETSDIVKGFEIDRDAYVVLEPDELDNIKLESKRTIDLVQFVNREDIDPRYFERPFYLAPEGDVSTEGFVVIRDALRRQNKVGLGRLTMHGREYLVAVIPFNKGLLVETLRYSNELRAADTFFEDVPDIQPSKEAVDLAAQLIEGKTKAFDPAAFHDAYAEALRQLVETKREGHAIIKAREEPRPSGKVIDLIAALKKSVGEQAQAEPTPKSRGPRPASAGKAAKKTGKPAPAKRRA